MHRSANVSHYEHAFNEAKREQVRNSLKGQIDIGYLGVIAARARIGEGKLYAWANDASSLLTASEFEDLAETLGVELNERDDMQQFGTHGEDH